MRITFVLPAPFLSGGIRVVVQYAKGLQQRGHDVRIVAIPNHDSIRLRRKIKSLVLGRGWPAESPVEPSFFDGSSVPLHLIERRRPIEDKDVSDADVVVATWWETAEWVARLSPQKGAKAYFIQQYEANFDQPADRVDATWRLPLHKIVTARWLADMARERFGDPHTTLATNGIDTTLFDAPPRGKQPRPRVGVMYSVLPPKAWSIALSALIEARRHVPDLHVVSFGAFEPRSHLPLPPDTTFEHRPPQERLRELYSQCDVWLCSSSSEGFHLPPHEAMACRCPVVSTRVGGPMDLIKDGLHGYLVDPFDACALADRLVRVLTLPELQWQQMSDAAYAEARRHNWEDKTDQFEQALKLAIKRAALGEIAGGRRGVASP
jgi:glycosyltransferase involved in cell wall biosynthesis